MTPDVEFQLLEIADSLANSEDPLAKDAVFRLGRLIEREYEFEEEMVSHLPPSLDTESFRSAWIDYLNWRKKQRFLTWKPETIHKKLTELAVIGADKAIACMDFSISNGYQGLFVERFLPKRTPEERQMERMHREYERHQR